MSLANRLSLGPRLKIFRSASTYKSSRSDPHRQASGVRGRVYLGPAVIAANLHRRHLSESQRAMFAAQIENGKHGGDHTSENGNSKEQEANCALARAEAATMFNVSPGSVKRAACVVKHGTPALQDAVRSGRIKVSRAAKIAKLLAKEQEAKLVMAILTVQLDGPPRCQVGDHRHAASKSQWRTVIFPENQASEKTTKDMTHFLAGAGQIGGSKSAACWARVL